MLLLVMSHHLAGLKPCPTRASHLAWLKACPTRALHLAGLNCPSRALRVGACLFALLLAAGRVLAAEPMSLVALFPVDNLSAEAVPAAEVQQYLARVLQAEGVKVLGQDALDEFMTRHRVRYAAGVDRQTARALREETGADGVLIASFELLSRLVAPKVALTARLVSVLHETPQVIWADDVGLAGDDAPGWLGVGLVYDYDTLQARALEKLGRSLSSYVRTGEPGARRGAASKFQPRTAFRGHIGDPGTTYTVAVLPFFNLSARRNAGDIMALLFMRHLAAGPFRVLDAGDVRDQLLRARVIMDGGISITDADIVGSVLEADYVLAGRVISYEDYDGPEVNPRVAFSTVLVERATRRVVWSSQSDNDGYDGVRFFGRGASRTAHTMASQMVRITTDMIAGGER